MPYFPSVSTRRRSSVLKTIGGKGSTALSDYGAIQLVDGKHTNARQPIAGGTPIIADHFAVDRYDEIPEEIKDIVKTYWISYAGESHSGAVRAGALLLQAADASFAVAVQDTGTPEGPSSAHMRVSRATWGDMTAATGWRYEYGEEDFYASAAGRAQTKIGLTYCHNNIPLRALVFGWCWDMVWHNALTVTKDPVYKCGWAGASVGGPEGDLAWGLDSGDTAITGNSVNITTYLEAVQEYIAHAKAGGYITNVCFSTGPIDGYLNETGYQRELKNNAIRKFVANKNVFLFDYADIIAWNNAGAENSLLWKDADGDYHSYQSIAADNNLNLDGSDGSGTTGYHFGERGALRLGKALWYLMARMAGWVPSTTGAPTISAISLSSGEPGDTFTITGTNFTGAQSVKIGNRPCAYTIDSSTQITATIPTRCASGRVSVYNAIAKATGATLTVTIPPWVTITVDTDGVSGDYATLAAALASLSGAFDNNVHIECYASTGVADTTMPGTLAFNTTSAFWLTITGHSGYVFAPAGASRWTIAPSSTTYYGNIIIRGMAFEKTSMSANYQGILQVSTYRYGQIRLVGNRFLGQDIGGTYRDRLIDINIDPAYSATLVIANNVIIGRSTSVSTANNLIYSTLAGKAYIYANTMRGYMSNNANANEVWKNNVIKTTYASGAVNAESNYNQFSGAFTFGGANDRQGRTFTFTNEATLDFHLSNADTGAQNAGTSLASDAYYPVTTDYDGVARGDPPDCGAFEVV